MSKTDTSALRIRRLADLIAQRFDGNRAAFGRALGHHDGSSVRKMLSGARPISEKTVARIEDAMGLEGWFSWTPGHSMLDASDASDPAASMVVPVLGTTMTGPQRPLDWTEPWRLRDGDRYVEAFLDPRTSRQHAYALQVEGAASSPRNLHGEWLVVSPLAQPDPGDDVVLKTLEGAVVVCQLAALYEEHLVLLALTPTLARSTQRRSDLAFMHLISMSLPRRRGLRHVDRPGYCGPDRRRASVPVAVERRRA